MDSKSTILRVTPFGTMVLAERARTTTERTGFKARPATTKDPSPPGPATENEVYPKR